MKERFYMEDGNNMELKDRMAIINDKAKRINDEKRIKEEKNRYGKKRTVEQNFLT